MFELATHGRNFDRTTALLASAARTANSTGSDEVKLPDAPNGYAFLLDITAAATDAGDTLDVWVQTRIDDTWVDVAQFTQHAGNGGAAKYVCKIAAGLAETTFTVAALATPGAVRNILGDGYRVRWTITDAGTDNASFTFAVDAIPM